MSEKKEEVNVELEEMKLESKTRQAYFDGLAALTDLAKNGKTEKFRIEAVRGLWAAYDMIIRDREMGELAERVNEKGADVIAQVKRLKKKNERKPWDKSEGYDEDEDGE